MTANDAREVSISIEHPNLGPYGALLRIFDHADVIAEYRIDLRNLEALHRNIVTSVLPSEHERQLTDAVCGHCNVCSDTRMVTVERHGHPWREHCPVCHPKLDVADTERRTWGRS